MGQCRGLEGGRLSSARAEKEKEGKYINTLEMMNASTKETTLSQREKVKGLQNLPMIQILKNYSCI